MSSLGLELHNVFVYGSFQEPDIVKVMLDRVPDIIPATLPGFKRFRLKGRLFPCIVPYEKGEVHGKVLMGLTDEELGHLDTCEGTEYERVTVMVLRNDNSEKMTVKTYIWINKDDPNMYGEWDFEEWKRLHKEEFVKTFKEIMEWKRNPQGRGWDQFTHVLREEVTGVAPPS